MFKSNAGIIAFMISCVSLLVALTGVFSEGIKSYHTLNMENTIGPLLRQVMVEACYPEGEDVSDHSGPSRNVGMISKREHQKGCISGIKNQLYARCYNWDWQDKKLFYTVTKDVSLGPGAYSCIDEQQVDIPEYDERLANLPIGKRVLVADQSDK
ncbi:hypothetical protein REH81_05525 [Vibrio rotiferianus]